VDMARSAWCSRRAPLRLALIAVTTRSGPRILILPLTMTTMILTTHKPI
jgi:hypothetical protein